MDARDGTLACELEPTARLLRSWTWGKRLARMLTATVRVWRVGAKLLTLGRLGPVPVRAYRDFPRGAEKR